MIVKFDRETKPSSGDKPIAVVLVCSKCEPGECGVGDYTRRLADGLADRGFSVSILALCDPRVAIPATENVGNGGRICCLRLPASSFFRRGGLVIAREFVEARDPAWVSMQFGGFYHYHLKGIPNRTLGRIGWVNRGFNVQLMLHELWVPWISQIPLKHRLVGLWQRWELRRGIARIRPQACFTSNEHYVERLRAAHIAARMIPLFGNIPLDASQIGWLPEKLRASGIQTTCGDRIAVAFGSMPGSWNPTKTLGKLADGVQRLGQNGKVLLVVIGSGSSRAREILAGLRSQLGSRVAIYETGRQSAAIISGIFQNAHLGIALYEWGDNARSGSAAAMREHGLSVVTEAPREWAKFQTEVSGVLREDLLTAEAICGLVRGRVWDGFETVVNQYGALFRGQVPLFRAIK